MVDTQENKNGYNGILLAVNLVNPTILSTYRRNFKMQCPVHGTTISPDICIKRQEIAKRGYLTKRTITKEKEEKIFQSELPDSFKFCCNCITGKMVKLFPGRYIKKDCLLLIKKHIEILKARGYIFKQDTNLLSLIVSIQNENLNPEERIVLIDYIAEVSKKMVTERRLNGKTIRVLSTSGCRIARYLRKQRGAKRNKQNNSSSIGA
jgi:hypothetical protein